MNQIINRSLENGKNKHIRHAIIHDKTIQLRISSKNITFIWVPNDRNIEGNENADREAKKALKLTNTTVLNVTTFSDTKNHMKALIEIEWQIRCPPTKTEHKTQRNQKQYL